MSSSRRNQTSHNIFPLKIKQLERMMKRNGNHLSDDLHFSIYQHQNKQIAVFYIPYLIDPQKRDEFLLTPLLNNETAWTNESLLNTIPLEEGKETHTIEGITENLLTGHICTYIEQEKEGILFPLQHIEERSLEKAETESIILGSQVAFTESLSTNLNVVRTNINSPDLVMEKIMVGERFPTEVRIIYIKSLANSSDINTMRQRIADLKVDQIEDSTVLKQYIEDNSMNIFPQFYSTELPDRFTYTVTKGKVGVLVNNSTTGFIGPSTLFSFFESTEDLYMRWHTGSFLRIIRFIAMFLAIIITPSYVAIVTYQYEILPTELLVSIGRSRAAVPFPPVIEALLLELIIELLREAGARLPAKVGQTMGIVGGIIIGEASVQAGLTSNILIIVVAMSALATFTTPSYLMGTSLRIIRFPLIILAGLYGLIGLMFGLCFIIIHLLRLTTLGRPYLSPLYPFEWKDFNKSFFRLPFQWQNKRARILRVKDLQRFSKVRATIKKDIDE